MSDNLKESNQIKTISVEKDTWVLELPSEICKREGFADGTLASLTVKNGVIQGTFIHPTQRAKQSAERFINKYGDFMNEMEQIDG